MDDSPLSITSNITGIVTFVVAIVAAVYARVAYLRNSHAEYWRVKKALLWFKTESEWLCKLLQPLAAADKQRRGHWPEMHMYNFIVDDLLALEQRLLDLVERIESAAEPSPGHRLVRPETAAATLLMPSWLRGRPSVTVAWLSSRTEMLELVRQREALTGRVQFLQLSMMSSRLTELEERTRWMGGVTEEFARKLGD